MPIRSRREQMWTRRDVKKRRCEVDACEMLRFARETVPVLVENAIADR